MSDLEREVPVESTERGLHAPVAREHERQDLDDAASSQRAERLGEERIQPEELGDQPSDDAPA